MNRFLRGTLILFISGIILKVMGFFYQVFIVRTIGTEAIGLVNMVHPYYIAPVIIATMGMPIAISRIVAKTEAKNENNGQIMRTAFKLVIVLSALTLVSALIFMPRIFARAGFDNRLRWCFYILLPGIIIVPLSSVMRGYFQGRRRMLSPALGQIFEQMCRISVGAGLIYFFKDAYQGYLALFLCAALICGEFGGLVLLSVFYLHERRSEKNLPLGEAHLAEMLALGVPATLTRLTSSVDLMAEAWILPAGLRKHGVTASESAALYGRLNSVCFTLVSLPGVLTNALATMLLPSIAALSVRDKAKLKEKCADSILVTYMFALPVAAIFYQEGGAMLALIYKLHDLEEVMRILSVCAIFIYLGQTMVGILQGLGRNQAVFWTNLSGSVLKIVLLAILVYDRGEGIKGAAWAFMAAYGGQCMIEFVLLKIYVGFRLSAKRLLLPFLASGAVWMMVPTFTANLQIFFGAWAPIWASVILCLGYLTILRLLGVFSLEMLS